VIARSCPDDQRMADSTTVTTEFTRPMIHPCALLSARIAAMATPMAITPPVAMSRTSRRSKADCRRLGARTRQP